MSISGCYPMRIISGEYRGRVLATVEGPGYRPATGKVREAVFSMLLARGFDPAGARVLDLFAGSGSLGFEALSRGAALAVFVEKSRKAAQCIQKNALALGVARGRVQVVAGDVFPWLDRRPEAPFDLVCIDPPYGKDLLAPALRAVAGRGWLVRGGFLLAEVEAGLDMDPETMHSGLEGVADKTYGQTRIVLWTTTSQENLQSTPEHLTP